MHTRHAFDYAVIRLVPQVEREEFFNVGVIMSCPAHDFLSSRLEVEETTFQFLGSLSDDGRLGRRDIHNPLCQK